MQKEYLQFYVKPSIELFLSPIEQGFVSSFEGGGNNGNDLEYGDGGDAW